MERIGFVGVGRMGANMARRLKDAGYTVSAVFDADHVRARELAAEIGAMAPEKLAAVTAASDVIITVVTDDAAMHAIYAPQGDSLLTGAAGQDVRQRGHDHAVGARRGRRAGSPPPAAPRSRRAWRVRFRRRATANCT